MVVVGPGLAPMNWKREEFREAYRVLMRESPRFRDGAGQLSEDDWVAVNELLDEGKQPIEIAEDLGVSERAVEETGHPRACFRKYDHDWKKVRDCVEGLIDP